MNEFPVVIHDLQVIVLEIAYLLRSNASIIAGKIVERVIHLILVGVVVKRVTFGAITKDRVNTVMACMKAVFGPALNVNTYPSLRDMLKSPRQKDWRRLMFYRRTP